jgi:hypothetical protein
MTTSAISELPKQQFTTYPYNDHSNDYIPKTSGLRGKQLCRSMPIDNAKTDQRCCSSAGTIDAAIDVGYRNGVQSHLGIKAIQDYPCVSEYEMGKLSNDLQRKIQKYGIKLEIPDGLNPDKWTSTASEKTINFCKEVIFEKLAQDLERPNSGNPIAFTMQVLKHCQDWFMVRRHSQKNELIVLGD